MTHDDISASVLRASDLVSIADKLRYGAYGTIAPPSRPPYIFGLPEFRKSKYAPVGSAYIIEYGGRTVIIEGPTWKEYVAEGFAECRRYIATHCPLTCPPEWRR